MRNVRDEFCLHAGERDLSFQTAEDQDETGEDRGAEQPDERPREDEGPPPLSQESLPDIPFLS